MSFGFRSRGKLWDRFDVVEEVGRSARSSAVFVVIVNSVNSVNSVNVLDDNDAAVKESACSSRRGLCGVQQRPRLGGSVVLARH